MANETFAVDFSEVSDSYSVPDGIYEAQCKDVTKDRKDGGEYDYLAWEFSVNGATLTLNTSLSPKALFKLYEVLGALLKKEIPKSAVKITPSAYKGKWCTVQVANKEYNGKMYSNIIKVMPLSSTPTAIADEPEEELL